MNIKSNILIFGLLLICLSGFAQSKDNLLGKWQTTYDYDDYKIDVIYEIKKEDTNVSAYMFQISINGQSQNDNTEVMSNINMINENGTANYKIEYENNKYEVVAALKLATTDKLIVSYSISGFPNEEIWERIK